MKYSINPCCIPKEQRKTLNEKIIYLIEQDKAKDAGIKNQDIFDAYTGNGGLHGLERKDFASYSEYSEAKKEIENGQFFTPATLCALVMESLQLSCTDLVGDLTFGMGSFINFMPSESNFYGCEIDANAYKVAHHLFPAANLKHKDIRLYEAPVRLDYVVGNPPFNLNWWVKDGTQKISQLYYCLKAAESLKPLGILAIITPSSFLADSFSDGNAITEMEKHFSFLGQVLLPENSFMNMGVSCFPTKLQFWQKKTDMEGWIPQPYVPEVTTALANLLHCDEVAEIIYNSFLAKAKEALEKNKSHVLLEIAKHGSGDFAYKVRKMLYQIKVHPKIRDRYSRCCEYLHKYNTQTQPADIDYQEWCKKRITEAKVLSYLRQTLKKQQFREPQDVISLVKQDYDFVYKGYSAKAQRQMTDDMKSPIPIYQAVLHRQPNEFPGFERLIRRKQKEYQLQTLQFSEMKEDPHIANWLSEFWLWDDENEEEVLLNDLQCHDINLMIQKRYGLLQWEQGSGKTLAGIAIGRYRMQMQGFHSTWVVSTAISIRNNWDVVLPNYQIPYVFVERLSDLERIELGNFVLITLNKVCQYKKQIKKWLRIHKNKIQLVFDESDEITNPSSKRTKAVLDCFRKSRTKLLDTGTVTRNNISEFSPQLELLNNNSVNMISWCEAIYHYEKGNAAEGLQAYRNPYYGEPIPPYKKGYALFAASHLPEKVTVFGMGKRTQDIYNAEILNDLLGKTVITRTFEEVTGKNIKRLHQVLINFSEPEKQVYALAVKEFETIRRNYFKSTGNSRKDSMFRLLQQITLLLRISAAPNTVREYAGGTPEKIQKVVEMAQEWNNECVAIGVRHKAVLQAYQKALQKAMPDRPIFAVTGTTTTLAKRKALRKTLRDSKNGILLCTQQSLPSSVNFEYVNKVIIPELHYNNARMSQFYFRFIRYTSVDFKDIYFVTYAGSIESNQMQMVLAKEKINMFMKGIDVDLDEINERFGVDYDLLSLLMSREIDEDGHFNIRWGDQKIS